jgi:phenylpyruvate tautomerase PptA (4-oxalocrotonate tautomerase family)
MSSLKQTQRSHLQSLSPSTLSLGGICTRTFDPNYLGIHRSDACVFIQITLNSGRTVEQKQHFHRAVADGLRETVGLCREDVFINLVEVPKENWSFGNGEAQYVTPTR